MTIIAGIMDAFEEAAQTINLEEEDDDQDECPAELLISQEKLADLCAEVCKFDFSSYHHTHTRTRPHAHTYTYTRIHIYIHTRANTYTNALFTLGQIKSNLFPPSQVAKLKASKGLHLVSMDRIVRVLSALERNVRDASRLTPYLEEEAEGAMVGGEEDKMWRDVVMERVLRSADAGLAALNIMCAPKMPKQVNCLQVSTAQV